MGFLRRCIEEKFVTEGIVLRGPAGSGKSALIKVHRSEKKNQRENGDFIIISCFMDKIFGSKQLGHEANSLLVPHEGPV